MDDSETPTYNLQIEPQDGCHPGDGVESRVTRLPSASDENENQLDEDGHEHLTSSDCAMGKPEVFEQDSLNNNESCTPGCEVAASENSENTPREGPQGGQAFLGKDKKIPGKRTLISKRGTAEKIPQELSSGDTTPLMQENVLSATTHAVSDEESAEVNANDPPEAPKLVLQSLFSLIRGEVEQLDSRALPLCLHQIAESYFQEEDYEKAMKFIQLERLYHEQLLANLSAIQEQWETKWRTVQPHTVTSLRNSEKGFNGEDFERLTKLCTTHQDPLLSKHKLAAVEKSLGGKCFTQLMASEDPKERGAAAQESESETCLGLEPSKESQHKEETGESSFCCNQMDRQANPRSLPVTAGKDHTEEPLCSAEATLQLHAQPSETAGSGSGPHSSENACESDSHLQLAQTEACQDVAEIEGVAEDSKVLLTSESMIEPLILPGSDHIPPALISEGKYSQTQRKELRLPLQDASKALPTDQLENNELNELQQPDLTDSDGKSPQEQTDSEGSESVLCENNKVSDLSTVLPEVYMAPEEKGDKDDQVNKETEDYLNSLLEGCLKDTEDSFSYEDNQEEDSDLQDLSPEEASYSLQENLPSDDSSLSLDDLAKRIEIAEVVPAEGLVSILKKRSDTVGDHPAQMHQKPSKRRVRFQEIDDNLDQDEVGGGSCILLVLLCIATVFLSVGGTALYCTFGDMESPVCTDFADNVDFYYTKLLQGMAELKHWIYLS
ncbi:consortin [Diceros bicornis minor]|uniref:consortin n=1 Tax=Diceros bicornis minor TaxID=77932 RepID=UPI0026EB0836|nr:consortin [Diceros bicornis minor]XP_058389547.1 consortin [Diceros bicornis minor]XP_058389548.1 consortin [Diceros bicornis minor]XP_058389549.1 consortin [Diceros bicornis minor]XP_058389551.1 consortin [Diceros bicornis minor]XP_058389552.1 consortin [Diceros bicornis minor]XP_058389553.1 consortin [Diceros bicornis minor]